MAICKSSVGYVTRFDTYRMQCIDAFFFLSLQHVVRLTLGQSRDKESNSTTTDICAKSELLVPIQIEKRFYSRNTNKLITWQKMA